VAGVIEKFRSREEESSDHLTRDHLLRERQQARDLLRLRSHLISSGIHESRGALVAVRGYSKLLLEGDAGSLNSTQQEYLGIIAASAQRLATVLANLGRLAANEDLVLEKCDFVDLWRAALGSMEPQISAKSVRLHAGIPARRLWITADPARLGEALLNILGGFLGLVPDSGELVAVVSASQEHLKVSVSDPRIGSPGSPSAGVPGQSAAEEIVRLHGGSFSTNLGSGEGLTVSFTLPLLDEDSGAA
jgi:signal transduction histidine kinase